MMNCSVATETMSPMIGHFWMPSAPIGTGVYSIVSTVSANPNSVHRESLAKLRRCEDQEFMQHIEAAPDVRRTGCVDQITPSVVSSTGFLPMSPLDRHAGWASTAEALERPQP